MIILKKKRLKVWWGNECIANVILSGPESVIEQMAGEIAVQTWAKYPNAASSSTLSRSGKELRVELTAEGPF